MPFSRHPDVIVVGAGIAGLAAARELGRGGLSVCLLEARKRIGGRIFSAHDATSNTEIPLGAEFIHGLPAEIWSPLRESGIEIQEIGGESWCTSRGQLHPCDFFSQIDPILDKMDDSTRDESFLDFLQSYPTHTAAQEEAKRRAIGYVTGFNAADPSRVGVHWLVKGRQAEKRIQGDRVFRARGGYGALVEIFREQTVPHVPMVLTATLVEHVGWSSGRVEVATRSRRGAAVLNAPCVLITLPLSVLKAPAGQRGAVRFTPALPQQKRDAMDRLEMGKVIRVSLKFHKRFWDNISPSNQHGKTLSGMGFLFSQDEWFPTWWTTFPERLPILTGWAPSRSAERLSGRDRSFVIGRCLQSLGETLSQDSQTLTDLLEAAYFHDWQSDPFSCGAYSYGKVGAEGAQEALAKAVKRTLFFAGEATDIGGNNGTVHGAIASGYRAAKEILQR